MRRAAGGVRVRRRETGRPSAAYVWVLGRVVLGVAAGATAGGVFAEAWAASGASPAAGSWIERLGSWAYLVAPLVMTVVSILPIPAELPAAANGMLFGPVVGSLITWGGALAGALVSFELSRRFGRPLGERIVGPSVMDRADRVAVSVGWPGLLLLRLLPTIAFTAINWGAGLTRLERVTFLWTTALGILPGAVLFTISGSGLAALYRAHPVLAWLLGGVGLAVLWGAVARYRNLPGWATGEHRIAGGARAGGRGRE